MIEEIILMLEALATKKYMDNMIDYVSWYGGTSREDAVIWCDEFIPTWRTGPRTDRVTYVKGVFDNR